MLSRTTKTGLVITLAILRNPLGKRRSAGWQMFSPGFGKAQAGGPCHFLLGLGRAEDFEGADSGSGAALDANLLEDRTEVLLHGLLAHLEDDGHVGVTL